MKISLISLLLIFLVVYVVCSFYSDRIIKARKRERCYEEFKEEFPLTKYCPGKKKNRLLCTGCKYNMDNHDYCIEKIPDEEKIVQGFEIDK